MVPMFLGQNREINVSLKLLQRENNPLNLWQRGFLKAYCLIKIKRSTGSLKRHKKQSKKENMEYTSRVYERGTFF
jgi:hypothetical protein